MKKAPLYLTTMAPEQMVGAPTNQNFLSQPNPIPAAYTPPAAPTGFTQADLEAFAEKARQQEKDKLYGELNKRDEVLNALKADADARKAAEEEARKAAEAAAKAAEEKEMSAVELVKRAQEDFARQLEEREHNWSAKIEELEQQAATERAILEKERLFNDLRAHAQAKVAENADKIAPELVDWIQGNSVEEIDAAVERAIATSAQIAQQFQQIAPGQEFVPAVAPVGPGTSTASGPVNLDPTQQYQQITVEQIGEMDMATYAANRGRLGVTGTTRNVGMYG